MAAGAAPRSIRVLQLLALVAPSVAIALLIDRYGVDVPITDQWNGMVPYAHRPPNAVVFTYQARGEDPVIFSLAVPGWRPRNDLVGASGDTAFLHSGWNERFDPGRVPNGDVVVKAWAFDADRNRAYRLAGEVPRPRP